MCQRTENVVLFDVPVETNTGEVRNLDYFLNGSREKDLERAEVARRAEIRAV